METALAKKKEIQGNISRQMCISSYFKFHWLLLKCLMNSTTTSYTWFWLNVITCVDRARR